MINQKESKQVRMDSSLLKLMSRDMKTKKKKQRSTNKQSQKMTKNIKEQKNKSNGKYNTYHGPLSQKLIDGRHVNSDNE